MRVIINVLLVLGMVGFFPQHGEAQILNKLKRKVNEIKDVFEPEEQEKPERNEPVSDGSRQGKYLTPPSVTDNLANARDAANAADYSAARDLVKQAMVGVEMEIAREVLNSLPETVNGLGFVKAEDELYSSGMNFVGMGISRYYGSNKKSLEVSIVNNSAMMAAYGGLLGTGTYSTETENTQMKNIRIQGNRAVIKYNDQSDEYEIAAALGQSTIFILQGRRYSSEQEMMDSAGAFDLNDIKTRLGEQ